MKRKGILYQGMIILLCISLMVCIAMTAIIFVSQQLARDAAGKVVHKAHEHMVEQINNYMNTLEQVAYSVAYSPSVQKALLS